MTVEIYRNLVHNAAINCRIQDSQFRSSVCSTKFNADSMHFNCHANLHGKNLNWTQHGILVRGITNLSFCRQICPRVGSALNTPLSGPVL